ncbi:MAG: protease modulator HflC [Enterobacteriaceae bacterium]
MKKISFIFFTFLISIFYLSIFFVQEGQKGILLRFSKVLKDKDNQALIYDPGIHIKFPLIDKVKYLDSRIKTMENQADRFVTMEKKDLIIDSYIKWKINNFSKYYLSTGDGDYSNAEILLKKKFLDRLRSELGKLYVKCIVTDSRNQLMADVKNSLNSGTYNISSNLLSNSNQKYANSVSALGIEVVDVRIKQINLPIEVSEAIYQRMRAEREAVARRHRSKGKEEAEKIRALADYKVAKIISEAKKQSLIIKGEADAKVSKLYSNSFKKNLDFYFFVRSLKAYEKILNNSKDIIFINLNNEFLKFIKPPK